MLLRVTMLLMVCAAASLAADAPPWHAEGWKYRALADAPPPQGHDVAAVRLLHGGRASSSGAEFRVFDVGNGQPLPFQVDHHDPRRDTLIRYRHPGGEGRVAIYFGNNEASLDPLRAIVSDVPGAMPQAGPAAEGWLPRVGLVLITRRRPAQVDHPRDLDQLVALLHAAGDYDGAGYRANISDGVNPFGDSDHYISHYRGWLHLPAGGEYGFCTASDEGSFSFIDGNELVHWPGRHGVRVGLHGDVNVQRSLQAGPRYVEYLQEETIELQMAFLGMKLPGAGRWDAIPGKFWPQPVAATVRCYESAGGGPEVAIEAALLDSVWPSGGADSQFTRMKLSAVGVGGDETGWSFQWSLGDGTRASSVSVDHVYLCPGEFEVTLQARSMDGRTSTANWPLRVFPVRHLVEPFVAGQVKSLAAVVDGYDVAALDTRSLAGLALLREELGQSAQAEAVAQRVLAKPDAKGEFYVAMAMLAYRNIGGINDGFVDSEIAADQVQLAAAVLQRAVEQSQARPRQLQVYAQLVRVLGLAGGDVAGAEQAHTAARALAKQTQPTVLSQAALRQVFLAMGDVKLHHGDADAAADVYRLAEALDEAPLPPAVRAAKRGAWLERIEQHAAAKRWDAVRQAATQWRSTLPSDQLQGPLLWWLGKSALELGDAAGARRPLELAVQAVSGSSVELDVRWHLAQTYEKLGDAQHRRRELRAILDSGIAGPQVQMAAEAIKDIASQTHTDEHR